SHQQGASDSPHAAHVGIERHLRRHDRRCHHRRRPGRRGRWRDPGFPRRRVRHHQRGRGLPRHRPDARHVPSAGRPPMNVTLAEYLYLVAVVLFIVGLKRMSSPRTARSGNQLAALGMLLAIVVTLLDQRIVSYVTIVAGLIVGGVVGAVLARRVGMTAMPQLVALFNGLGGGASAPVAVTENPPGAGDGSTGVTAAAAILIGTVTLTGSTVAFAKLQELMSGAPKTYPGQRIGDSLLGLTMLAAAVVLVVTGGDVAWAWTSAGLAAVLGVTR